MCWKEEQELYNEGAAFKLTARDERGVIVTVIADNYFGYCKKEVKTQISYAANLYGLCEEEHAGGALVYPSYDLGEEFYTRPTRAFPAGIRSRRSCNWPARPWTLQPEGYADRQAVPRHHLRARATFTSICASKPSPGPRRAESRRSSCWPADYVRPSGYRVHMEKPSAIHSWRLVGTVAEPTLCHKPCTVSGGGKSEISKPITDAILHGPVFTADFKKDFDLVGELIAPRLLGPFPRPGRKPARTSGRS